MNCMLCTANEGDLPHSWMDGVGSNKTAKHQSRLHYPNVLPSETSNKMTPGDITGRIYEKKP